MEEKKDREEAKGVQRATYLEAVSGHCVLFLQQVMHIYFTDF